MGVNETLTEWAAGNPRVARLWLLECRDPDDALWTREPGAHEARTLVYERAS